MTLRAALANSYNIPAVKALQYVGVDALLATAEKLGVQSLVHPQGLPDPNDPTKKLSGTGCPDYPYDTAPAYGLALTLGGGETTLLEMTGAYAVFANGGKRVPPTVLLKVTDNSGNVLLDYEQDLPAGDQVITPGTAYLITSILSDAEARAPMFGINSILNLDRPAAAKTGTTNDYRDNWTIGYTPDLVTGVWVGNNDNTEMGHVSGITGAAPIWHNFMVAAHGGRPARDFARPDDVVEMEVCADSGTRPSEKCPNRRTGLFLKESPPPPAQLDYWRKVKIDTFTGLLTNEFCPGSSEEQWFFVLPEEQPVRDWVNNTAAGQEWAHARNLIPLPEWAALAPDQQAEARASGRIPVLDPPREFCNEQTTRPEVVITSPVEGQEIAGPIELIGTAKAPDFAYYVIEYGVSWNPGAWGEAQGPTYTQVENGPLGTWNPAAFDRDTGDFSLRVIVYNTKGGKAESTPVHVRLVEPTPTPTQTPMPTATDTPVPTSTPTSTPGPAWTPTPTWTPFVPPTPTDTPAPPTPTSTAQPPTEPPPTPTDTPPPGSEPTRPPS
jgi:membrane peptidoglycan carboxypeptidase